MPERCVVDASVGMRIVQDDDPAHEEARTALQRLLAAGWEVFAPDLYLYETGNVIARSKTKADRASRLVDAYEIVQIQRPSPDALQRALAVAGEGKLSFYDAAYLALAEQSGAILWTEDKELLKRFPGQTASTAELLRKLGNG